MKKIIDGKRYDTDTAEEVASWSNHLSCTDFGHCEETLYRTKKGNFFLHGKGGAMSRYSEGNGREQWGGSAIIPMSNDEAKAWLEEHDECDAIEQYFASEVEDA